MIKPLEDALGKVLRLSEQKQAIAAELLEQLAQSDAVPYALSPDQRTVVREAMARVEQGKFVSDAEVGATLWQPWA